MMYFNIHSLPKNLTSLNDFILTVKETPEIIAVSETKLDDQNIYNISIPGYVFLNTNSPTRAGGVGLYISKELTFIRRRDLEMGGFMLMSLFTFLLICIRLCAQKKTCLVYSYFN